MKSVRRLPEVWGSTPAEEARTYPSARFASPGSVRALRAVDVAATPAATWAWVCQVRRAPYSYDLIDNLGRRSPRTLDPSLLDLELGQTVTTYFTLVDFVPGESMTIVVREGLGTRVFGRVVLDYVVTAAPGGGSRLIGVVEAPAAGRVLPRARRSALLWGDLVMMRKQLRTLGSLAETRPPVPDV